MHVLLIGSSFSAMPMLMALKARGFHVTTMGKHAGDPCHAYSDGAIFEDYSDKDALFDACQKHKFDFIIPTCNDYSYLAASYVAGIMNYAGFDRAEATQILHVKDRFRQFCEEAGIPAPRTYGHFNAQEPLNLAEFSGQALVKPVDSFSGRGVTRVSNVAEAIGAAKMAFSMSRTSAAVVEQFVDGGLHSHTSFIVDGKIVWHDFVDEFCEVYPYQVDRSSYPSRLSTAQKASVHSAMEKLVKELDLVNGLLHTQFIASETEFWIIECMRRCPGDLYGHQFKYAFAFDYEDAYISGFLGETPNFPTLSERTTQVERRIVSVDKDVPFFGTGLNAQGREVIYVPLKESGQKLGPAPFDKAAIVFFRGAKETSADGKAAQPIFLPAYGVP